MLTNIFLHIKYFKNYIKILKNQKWTFINVQNPKNFQIIFFKKSGIKLFNALSFGGSWATLEGYQVSLKKCYKYFT